MSIDAPLEIRLALRTIRRRPWQPLAAVVTLAIAIGAMGLMLAAVYDIVLRPLPYRDGSRILAVRDATDLLSADALDALRGSSSLTSIGSFAELQLTFRDGDRARRIAAAAVDSQFMPVLGVPAFRGRNFAQTDFLDGAPPAVVVSHAFARRWRTAAAAVGAAIVLDGVRQTVVGVMPPGFEFPTSVEVWTPRRRDAGRTDIAMLQAVARLRSGVSRAAAAAELSAIGRRRIVDRSNAAPPGAFHADALADVARADVRSSFWILVAVVSMTFVLTFVTLAGLFVARAVARGRDIAIHAALGATPRQLFRQQVAESAIVCITGALLGGGVLWIGARAIPHLSMRQEWWPTELVIDWRVTTGVAVLATGVAALIALIPVLRFKNIDPQAALRAGGAGLTATAGQRRLQGAFLGVEIAVVMFLVMAAGTLGKTYVSSERLAWGYDTRGTLFGTIALPQPRFEPAAARRDLVAQVARGLRAIRGVGNVTVFAEGFPIWNAGTKKRVVDVTGSAEPRGLPHATIDVDTAFFSTMGVRIVRGRGITSADVAGAAPVAVVDEALARRNWPDVDPIGQQIKLTDMEPTGPWYTIVGVAAQAIELSSIAPLVVTGRVKTAVMYRALAQVAPTWPSGSARFAPGFAFAVRSARGANASAHLAQVRAAVAVSAPDQPLENFGTLQQYFNINGLGARSKALAFALACAFGVSLCALGIVALVADGVARRTREIGIRIALGSPRAGIVGIVLEEVIVYALAGVAAGVAVSIVVARIAGSVIFGFGGGVDDPVVVIGGMTALLLLVGTAAMIPAIRALRIDPAASLRAE